MVFFDFLFGKWFSSLNIEFPEEFLVEIIVMNNFPPPGFAILNFDFEGMLLSF
jgi:hypothetical protein